MTTMKLPNGCTSLKPTHVPNGEKDAEVADAKCKCGFTCTSFFIFVKHGVWWVRARHEGGAGFCETPCGKSPGNS